MKLNSNRTQLNIASIKAPSVNTIWVAGSFHGIYAIDFNCQKEEFIHTINKIGACEIQENEDILLPALFQLKEYFLGQRKVFDLSLDTQHWSQFSFLVREKVAQIPHGQTRTYGQIAEQVGRPGAARAVGRANATNPLPILIPCHRLVGSQGGLRGYGAGKGIESKTWLIKHEKDNA